MKDAYILKEVEEVTQIAKNIFGDIVHKVYYAGLAFGDDERTVLTINNEIKSAFNKEDGIDQDGRTIIIEFINGKQVIFSNSEWGSMEAFNSNEIKMIL